MPDLIVIPARFGSQRLPGKPLIEIAGRTMLDRVAAIARAAAGLAGACEVMIATDDQRIINHAAQLGHAAMMTAEDIRSGSDRALAVAKSRDEPPMIVVNLQGDAPFIPAEIVAQLLAEARTSGADCVTPVVRLDWEALDAMREHKRIAPFSGTTCVRTADGRALWFSKTILPAIRNEARLREAGPLSPVFRHLGLYAYRMEALARFAATPPTPYESLEGLEQLRMLESGLTVRTIEVAPPDHAMSGIDTQADVGLAEALIARWGDPYPT
jgi:3-deoxy-manno-octulosonate cytidylyltransferase (CMP-KDO synthetase)